VQADVWERDDSELDNLGALGAAARVLLRTTGVPEVRALGNLPDAAPMLRGM